MRAINNCLDSVTPRHLTDRFDRGDLSGEVDLVRDLKQARPRRDRSFKRGRDLANVLWWDWNLDQVQLDAFALLALPNRCQHPAIVLRGGQNLVTGFQVHPEEHSFQLLRRVAAR